MVDELRPYLTRKANEVLAELTTRPVERFECSYAVNRELTVYITVEPTKTRESLEAKPDTGKVVQIEQDIVTALGDGAMSGSELARRAGYAHNSHFRSVLARLRKRRVIMRTVDGYRKSSQ
jgi:hypothetical protein